MNDKFPRPYDQLIADIDMRFTSGNSSPVERASIKADEWETIKRELVRRDAPEEAGDAVRDGHVIRHVVEDGSRSEVLWRDGIQPGKGTHIYLHPAARARIAASISSAVYSRGPVSDGGMDPRDRQTPTWNDGDRVLWQSSVGTEFPGTILRSYPSRFTGGATIDYDCALDAGTEALGYSAYRFKSLSENKPCNSQK